MIKVQILIQCEHSQEVARKTLWLTIGETAAMLETARCQHEHTSTWGGFHFSAGDVWDDIVEVCDDCGANLE